MKKKFLTGLLSVSMTAAMLTGCGGSTAPAEDTAQTEEADDTEEAAEAEEAGDDGEEASADEAQAAIDERKAEAEKNGEYEKIIIGFFDWTGTPAGIDRINEALSAHTEETLGLDVELQIIDSAAYGDDMKLMLSSGEQMDIFNTCILGYSTCINNEYVLDAEHSVSVSEQCTYSGCQRGACLHSVRFGTNGNGNGRCSADSGHLSLCAGKLCEGNYTRRSKGLRNTAK